MSDDLQAFQDRSMLLLERVDQLETVVAAEWAKVPPNRKKRGRPQGPRGEAIKRAALELEYTVRTAQRMESEARKVRDTAIAEAPPIDTMGYTFEAEYLDKVRKTRRLARELHAKLLAVLRVSEALKGEDLGLPKSRVEQIQASVQDAKDMMAALIPSSLCPYCKGHDPYQDTCTACWGLGWVSADKVKDLATSAPELLDLRKPMVRHQGKDVFLEEPTEPERWWENA